MLVPSIAQWTPSGVVRTATNAPSRERAETTVRPGAAISGLSRPSRVGPPLENHAMSPTASRCALHTVDVAIGQQWRVTNAPTVTARRAVPGVRITYALSNPAAPCAVNPVSVIQRWYGSPDAAAVARTRTVQDPAAGGPLVPQSLTWIQTWWSWF